MNLTWLQNVRMIDYQILAWQHIVVKAAVF